jgi:hypothetical protein
MSHELLMSPQGQILSRTVLFGEHMLFFRRISAALHILPCIIWMTHCYYSTCAGIYSS